MNVLKGAPLKISGEVIGGRTARQIIDRAKNWHADLIVVGGASATWVKATVVWWHLCSCCKWSALFRQDNPWPGLGAERIIAAPLKPIRAERWQRIQESWLEEGCLNVTSFYVEVRRVK